MTSTLVVVLAAAPPSGPLVEFVLYSLLCAVLLGLAVGLIG